MAAQPYLALPHQYRVALTIRDPVAFADDYGDQEKSMSDCCLIIAPGSETLKEWACTCLRLGVFFELNMNTEAGWSPFRSATVCVHASQDIGGAGMPQGIWGCHCVSRRSAGDKGHTYFKFGDSGRYDFTSSENPENHSLDEWLETLRAFVRNALGQYVLAHKDGVPLGECCVISPCWAVEKMLQRELGLAGDHLTYLLCRARIEPFNLFHGMVQEAWSVMVRGKYFHPYPYLQAISTF
jgi:hypothetical protein